jgi:hypothetical protein
VLLRRLRPPERGDEGRGRVPFGDVYVLEFRSDRDEEPSKSRPPPTPPSFVGVGEPPPPPEEEDLALMGAKLPAGVRDRERVPLAPAELLDVAVVVVGLPTNARAGLPLVVGPLPRPTRLALLRPGYKTHSEEC